MSTVSPEEEIERLNEQLHQLQLDLVETSSRLNSALANLQTENRRVNDLREEVRESKSELNQRNVDLVRATENFQRKINQLQETNEELKVATAELQRKKDSMTKANWTARQKFHLTLHDTTLNQLKLLLLNCPQDANGNLSVPAIVVEKTRDELEGILEFIAPQALRRGDLYGAFVDLAHRFNELKGRDDSGTEAKLLVKPISLAGLTKHELNAFFDLDVKSEIYYMIWEALNNTSKHAKATEAHIRIALAQGSLTISLVDDGRGMGADRAGSHGKQGQSTRADEMGATIDYFPGTASERGCGTEFRLTLAPHTWTRESREKFA